MHFHRSSIGALTLAAALLVTTVISAENNNHVEIQGRGYMLSADGFLMPTRKDQPPPDLRYFEQAWK